MYKIGNIVHDILQDEPVMIMGASKNTNPTIYLVLNNNNDKYYVSEDDIDLM